MRKRLLKKRNKLRDRPKKDAGIPVGKGSHTGPKKEKAGRKKARAPGKCTPITRDPDFTYHSDIKSQLEFSPLCSDAVDGQKCRIQPVSGTKCAALSKGGIWLQI